MIQKQNKKYGKDKSFALKLSKGMNLFTKVSLALNFNPQKRNFVELNNG